MTIVSQDPSTEKVIAPEETVVTIVSQDAPQPLSSPASAQDIAPHSEEIEDIPKMTVALALEPTHVDSADKGKAIAQEDSSMLAKMPEAVGTMSELCKGMEWLVHFSTFMLCAMNNWSPTNSADESPILEPETKEPSSSQGLSNIDLNIALPL